MSASNHERILDAGERMARARGYNGFSFREVALEVGIKSASVHYHFPTKADLGAAIARRYTDRFLAGLPPADAPETAPQEALGAYVAAFRRALNVDGLMCLCGILGAESDSLPASVAAEARRFFELNLDWLQAMYARAEAPDPLGAATRQLATLEGAMILARVLDDPAVFERAASA